MLEIVKNGILVAGIFREIVNDILSSPTQSVRLAEFALQIKDKFDAYGDDDMARAIFESLEILLKFKDDCPQDFDRIFDILERALEVYKRNETQSQELINALIKG